MQEITILGGDPLTFSLSGEIDSENSDELFETVMGEYKASPRDIVFECNRLSFIDSTTLGTFVKILNLAKADGHTLRLTALKPQLKKLFVICALDRIMELE